MVDLYNILYKYAVDTASPEYKAPLNTIYNTRHVMTPEDTAIVAPNRTRPTPMRGWICAPSRSW